MLERESYSINKLKLISVPTGFMNDFNSSLTNGQTLNTTSLDGTSKLKSKNLKYVLKVQADGNVVMNNRHRWNSGTSLWHSGSHGKGTSPHHLKMEHSNDLVLYDGTGNVTWTSGTEGMGRQGAGQLALQNDGTVVIHDGSTILWKKP